jgi:hypothetical protein
MDEIIDEAVVIIDDEDHGERLKGLY